MATTSSDVRVLSHLIGGDRAAPAGDLIDSVNPADRTDVVARVPLASAETFVDAARAAKAAQPGWAAVPAPVRGQVIAAIGQLVRSNKEALSRLVTREMGKPYAESLGEVQEVIDTCDFFLGEGRRLYGQTVPSEVGDKQLFTFRRPVGTLAIVTAANFPIAVPSWYIIPALLAGNAVVWKPSEMTPAVGDAFAEIMSRAGLPHGVLNLVHANGVNTYDGLGAALEAGLVDKVGFTGSTEVGRAISELAGRFLQTPILELGGKNPLVVAADADLDLAVEGALFGGFGTAGQRCTSTGTIWVHQDVHDEFLRRFTAAVENAVIGDPTQDVLYGPLIAEAYLRRYESYLDWIGDHHTVSGSTSTGQITADAPRKGFVGDPADGFYAHPVIVDGVRPGDDLYAKETFGPLLGVGTYQHLDEAIELANGHGYGLSSAIYTNDPKTAFAFANGISAGMTSVNNSTSGAEAHLPFGGNGLSGNGSRQSGIWVLDAVTRWQSLNWDYSGRLQKAQMDTAVLPADLDFRL
ncbi:aldehyde dehydrogenase family protein [Fodinicola acaciae]|uniref:aldehyde dehydrogenase family protein n=1 Tax=Fodinicola acaciae TaxID=2681555 RepID=UPI0013D5DA55|nr:aldehyde dehydrogenase family protein [Fodinicola acaciae]